MNYVPTSGTMTLLMIVVGSDPFGLNLTTYMASVPKVEGLRIHPATVRVPRTRPETGGTFASSTDAWTLSTVPSSEYTVS